MQRFITILMLSCAILLTGCKQADIKGSDETLRTVPREQRMALMVTNFKNSSLKQFASDYQPWEFGIPSMIMTDLESIGVFNVLSWDRLEEIMEQQAFQNYGMVDERQAVKMGKIVAAKFMLTGMFIVMDKNMRIESKIFSVETGTLLGASSVNGKVNDFFDLEKQLLVRMTDFMGTLLTRTERAKLEDNVETRSVEASLENYAGEMVLTKAKREKAQGDKGKYKMLIMEARVRFERALQHDPGYQRAKRNLASLTKAMPMTL